MAVRRRTPDTELGQALRQQFAQNIRHLRSLKGMTQLELAQRAGLGRTFVSQLEAGHYSATLETVAAIAKALGVAPTLLLTSRF